MRPTLRVSKWLGIALASLIMVGCATSGVSVCTQQEIEAKRKAGTYEGLAKSYRARNDEDQAQYYDEKARNERWKAASEPGWFTAIVLGILGTTCDHD